MSTEPDFTISETEISTSEEISSDTKTSFVSAELDTSVKSDSFDSAEFSILDSFDDTETSLVFIESAESGISDACAFSVFDEFVTCDVSNTSSVSAELDTCET
jgi:hypothetical protein